MSTKQDTKQKNPVHKESRMPDKKDPMWIAATENKIKTRADLDKINKASYAYWEKWIEENMPGYCVEDFDLYHHNCDLDEDELADLS